MITSRRKYSTEEKYYVRNMLYPSTNTHLHLHLHLKKHENSQLESL